MEADSTQSDGDSAETSRKPANPLLRPGSMGTENRGTDKSPLGQKPTRTKAHWTISHWTKAHCLIWQGGQKPTSLKKIGLSLL